MTSQNQEEVIEIFRNSGALLSGHFKLRSGLHSAHFFQCAQVCQHMDKVSRLAELLIPKLKDYKATTIVGPAMGGLVIAQEVARQMGLRYVFLEKVGNDLELRRNFKFPKGEKVLIIEDVITRGGRVIEAIKICKQAGAQPIGVGVIVDRSQNRATFEVPYHSLVELNFPTYEPDQLPAELACKPAIKPGS